ncbi:MAG: (Fe-S)-binding protein [Pseudomonadota bacterium]
MADVDAIARLMRELEEQLVVCMRCGMCQSVCPVYEQTGREADVARGKLALLAGLMTKIFDDPEGTLERLNKCLLCGSCAANCPSGVDTLGIFLKARAILTAAMGLSAPKKAILRGLLAHPALFDRLTEWGAVFQKVFTRPVNDVIGTSCARFMSPLIGERHFRPLAETPFHRQVPAMNQPTGNSGRRVALFVGCLIDKLFPDIALATLKIMDHHGVGVFLPEGQACCGIPAISSGDQETFNHLVAHNIALFENDAFDVLLTACATCTATIREVWPRMASGQPKNRQSAVARLSAKAMDINAYLVNELGVSPAAEPAPDAVAVAYHDPCHLKKSLGVFTEPRAVIRANPRYRLRELAAPDKCCGMGGSFNLQYYDISRSIGTLKRRDIESSGCRIVTTGCPACMAQISDMLSGAGVNVPVRHPIELYAEMIERKR